MTALDNRARWWSRAACSTADSELFFPISSAGLAISSAVLLVVSYVDKGLPVVIITVFVLCLFGGLWFALPLARRRFPG